MRSVTVEVPTTGQYLLRAFGEGRFVVVGRCFGCPWQHKDVLLGFTAEVEANLEAGLHFVRMEANASESPIVGVTIAPVE